MAMAQSKTRYLVDENGKRTAVVLDLNEYRRMIEQLDELEDLKAFDAAKASREKPVPLERAIEQMDGNRSAKSRRARWRSK